MSDHKMIIKKSSLVIFMISLITLLSCGDVAQKDQDQNNFQDINSADTLKIAHAGQPKAILKLIPEATKATKDWNVYRSLTKNLDSLKNPTLTDLQRTIPRMASIFENQEEAEKAAFNLTPDTLDTSAINARLLTVETQLKVVQNLIFKTRPDTDRIGLEITGVFNAFQDLNLQINHVFTKSVEEILKEFEEQQKKSIENIPEEQPTYTTFKRTG